MEHEQTDALEAARAAGALPPDLEELLHSSGPPAPPPMSRFWRGYLIAFGVVLPVLTLAVELLLRLCTGAFFDPLPTPVHIALYAGIAVFCLLLLRAAGGGARPPLWVLGGLYGMALVTTVVYTVQFLPILPISLLAVLLLGIGFCGLSPLLALIGMVYARAYLTSMARQEEHPRLPGLRRGLLVAVLLLAVVELPGAYTQLLMRQAQADAPAARAQAVRMLRAVGSREVLLRACYVRSGTNGAFLTAALAVISPLGTDEARVLYYRVTGQPFNAAPLPREMVRHRAAWDAEGMAWDDAVGGAAVAGRVRHLNLTTSRLDGSVDADAGLAYLEWTQEFHNTSGMAREARAQLALPPGAVVSRATLWVNGEEREAAFAARGRARQAYEEVVVVQRRDPLLVTTCGPDRVLVQCFPVPANGRMKIRLGITAPLQGDGALVLPAIIERNYGLGRDLRQQLWVEGDAPMTTAITGVKAERAASAYAVRGAMAVESAASVIRVQQPPAKLAWTPDPARPGAVIVQRPAPAPWKPDRVVFVLDGSAGMRAVEQHLPRIMDHFPAGIEYAVVAATDAGSLLARPPRPHAALHVSLETGIQRCEGGVDNLPALLRGLELAAEATRGAVVWIHGAQPLDGDMSALTQWWERRPNGPRLYALQVAPGPNRVLEAGEGVAGLATVAYTGALAEDLNRVYAVWRGQQPTWVRERVPGKRAGPGEKTSNHLARLWAADQVRTLRATGKLADIEMAIAIAARYHLVTPVTGAVVLENAQQYKDNGLEPVHAGSVPTIPEPEAWLLLLVAALVLGFAWWRKRRACPAA